MSVAGGPGTSAVGRCGRMRRARAFRRTRPKCENDLGGSMLLFAALLIAAPPSDGYPTTRGTAGASFAVSGDAAPTIGLTYFVFNDVAARIDFGLEAPITPGGAGQNTLYSVSGALRFYALKRSQAAVFLQPAVAIGRENSPAVSAEAAFFLRFGAGLGAEY